jgi:crotonobetainyl-CoA:carnitine CoA-transferase CaiB-like acyl-CoA transferase
MSDRPLEGMKVIDLTHVLAGPYCTYQLGRLGAEVTKVEPPKGDMVRSWGGSDQQLALKLGSGFVSQNAGKRSICVDITQPEGAAIVKSLSANADILVENYRPGALEKYGIGYDEISALNSEIIYVSISAFGQNGPHGHRPGFDDVIQATSAFLAASLLRYKTGKGQRVDIAMQDVTMLLLHRQVYHLKPLAIVMRRCWVGSRQKKAMSCSQGIYPITASHCAQRWSWTSMQA